MTNSRGSKLALIAVLVTGAAVSILPLTGALGAPAAAKVVVLPSSATISPTIAPAGGANAIQLNAAIGEREAAWMVVTGAKQISASIDTNALQGLPAGLSWGHYVHFSGRDVPDALLPWDGTARPAERRNQPLYFQVAVPYGAHPGIYRTTVTVTADSVATQIPVSVTVFPFQLPPPNAERGNLQTAFLTSAETFVKKTSELYHLTNNDERSAVNLSLFAFLAGYRISPARWGFGDPKSKAGYEQSAKWWLDAAGNMVKEASANGGFSAMRIPVSTNRASSGTVIAGLSPSQPQTWCSYLQSVNSFWEQHGWLNGRLPYLYTTDEPGLDGMKLVAQQAKVGHTCFPGSKMLVTGNPTTANRFAWDNKQGDDVDIWAVLSRRYYGQFSSPGTKVNRARQNLALVDAARKAGRTIWSYTYSAVAGSPGYAASEPLSDPRIFLLWNAFEGLQGTLYADGVTTYTSGNPLQTVDSGGTKVLLYPGPGGPIPSARLEQIRDGIEDWAILDAVRAKHGAASVRSILTGAGLFSGNANGATLACHMGCELKSSTKYSWPLWSQDASTPSRIEKAHLAALQLAG
jgi:Domain of unknown function (DUF4091)